MYTDTKLTQEDVSQMIAPFKLDLIAYYKILNEAVIEIMNKAIEDGVTPEELINNIDKLFEKEELR